MCILTHGALDVALQGHPPNVTEFLNAPYSGGLADFPVTRGAQIFSACKQLILWLCRAQGWALPRKYPARGC